MKKGRRLLSLVLVFAMSLVLSATAMAAGVTPVVSAIKADKGSVTVFTNEGENTAVINITADWTKPEEDTHTSACLKVTSSNRGVATVSGFVPVVTESVVKKGKTVYTTKGTITVTGVSNGKATIVVSDIYNTKKVKKINVVVKTNAANIDAEDVNVAVKGSVKLNPVVSAEAGNNNEVSVKGVSYTTAEAKIAKVNGSGVVTGVGEGTTTITIKSKDGKASKVVNVTVVNSAIIDMKAVDNKKETNKVNLKMVTNQKAEYGMNTYAILLKTKVAEGHMYDAVEDIDFTTSNAKVATVDALGNIKAVGNGKAVITATPKLGNKIKVTYNVTVNTKTDSLTVPSDITVPNNKKAFNIGAKVNANSQDKITYKVISCTADGATVAAGSYISVDAKGNVKAKKICDATILVKSGDIEKTVNVSSVEYIKDITFSLFGGKYKAANSQALIKNSGEDATLNPFKAVKVTGSNGTEYGMAKLKFRSSNDDIAKVEEDGSVKVFDAGKVVITAEDADGFGAKATMTINVTTASTAITVENAEKVDGKLVYYVEADKKITSANLIDAHTAYDATNKKLIFTPATFTLKAGEEKAVEIKAADGLSEAVTVTVKAVAKENLSTDFTFELENDSISLLPGDGEQLSFNDFNVKDGKEVVFSNIVYKSNNAKVAKVSTTGMITAVNAGTTTVTATLTQAGVTKTATATVTVGRKPADVQKDINTYIANALKDENRDYLGAKASFDAKNNAFVFDITDPTSSVADWKDTGLVDVFKNLPSNVVCGIIYIMDEDKEWVVSRENGGLSVLKVDAGEVVDKFYFDNVNDLIEFIKTDALAGYETLGDLAGKEMKILLVAQEGEFIYGEDYNEMIYTATFTISDAVLENWIDSSVADGVAEFNAPENRPEDLTGIAVADYDANSNVVTIDVVDSSVNLAALVDMLRDDYKSRKDIVTELDDKYHASLATIKSKTDEVNMVVYVDGNAEYEKTITNISGREDKGIDEIDVDREFSAKNQERLDNHELSYLEDTKVVVSTTFVIGEQTYVHEYTVVFKVAETAYDYKIDTQIDDEIVDNYDFGKVIYNADENTFVVDFVADKKFSESEDSVEFAKLFSDILSENGACAVEFVGVKGDITVLEGADIKNNIKVFHALTSSDTKLSDKTDAIAGKKSVIKATYKTENGKVYTITYTVVYDSIDGEVTTENNKEVVETEAIVEEVSEETEEVVEEVEEIEE